MQPTTPEPRRQLLLLKHTDPRDPGILEIINDLSLQGWLLHTRETSPLQNGYYCTTLTFITNPQSENQQSTK